LCWISIINFTELFEQLMHAMTEVVGVFVRFSLLPPILAGFPFALLVFAAR
jgi:hypothetical protein